MLLFVVLSLTCAFNLQQERLFRGLTGTGTGVNPYVALHEAPIANELAYTSVDRTHIYMDAKRMQFTPHTFYNVLRHEIAHTKGAEHGDGSPEMNYAATEDVNGIVIDDGFLL